MNQKLLWVWLGILIFTASSVYSSSELSQNTIKLQHEITTKKGSFASAVELFTHLNIYYTELHSDHISFELENSSQLGSGVIVINEEQSGPQHIIHNYVVNPFIIDSETKKIYVVLTSENSEVTTLGFSKMNVKTTVTFELFPTSEGNFKVKSEITIQFRSGWDLFLAKLVRTRSIWQKHLEEELLGGARIVERLHEKNI